jgi:putative serine protease PepD
MTDNSPGPQEPERGQVHDSGEPTPPNPWSAHAQPQGSPEEPAQVVYGSAAPQEQSYTPPPQEQPHVVYGTGAPGPYVPQAHTQTYPTPPAVDRPPRRGSGLVVGVAVLALLVGGGAGALGGYLTAGSKVASAPSALDAPKPAQQASTAAPGSVESVADKLLPSVVQLQTRSGEGSGFVIRQDGLIVTNNHVIAEAAQPGSALKVVFQDGQSADGTVLGRDSSSDLAVVQAKGVSGKIPVQLGSSDNLKVGQAVVAIGSPFDLSGTVTSGIVSSLHRPTSAGGDEGGQATVMDAIQTDAAINPGNSGGPLVNMNGEVVGINSAIYSPNSGGGGGGRGQQGGSVGIGFAIPIDQARRTADEIVKTGKATQTVLGVTVQTPQTGGGAQVQTVIDGGAAQQAGVAVGDVITKMDDRRIDTSDALVAAVRSKAPGDKVTLTIGNGTRTVQVTLGGQPAPTN